MISFIGFIGIAQRVIFIMVILFLACFGGGLGYCSRHGMDQVMMHWPLWFLQNGWGDNVGGGDDFWEMNEVIHGK